MTEEETRVYNTVLCQLPECTSQGVLVIKNEGVPVLLLTLERNKIPLAVQAFTNEESIKTLIKGLEGGLKAFKDLS